MPGTTRKPSNSRVRPGPFRDPIADILMSGALTNWYSRIEAGGR